MAMKTFWRFRQFLILAGLLLALSSPVRGEHLPLKAYTVADGLPNDVINKIVADSHGFLWFCTDDGLSRFDGYEFTNYGTDQGLPHAVVNDFLETRDGEYWVATNGGLCKFDPRGIPTSQVVYANQRPANAPREPMFTVFTPASNDRYSRATTTLLQGRDGTIWFGTWNGIFRRELENGRTILRPVGIGLGTDYPEQRFINTLLQDRHGALWVGGPGGLYRLWPDGSVARYGKANGLPDDFIHDLLEDGDGNLWVATRYGGFFQLGIDSGHGSPVIKRAYNDKNGLETKWVFDLFMKSDGKLWVGTNFGLSEFSMNDESKMGPLHVYSRVNGFSYHEIANVAEDREGNLWLGTVNGAMKLARRGFTTFDERDGVCCARSFFQSGAGEHYAYAHVRGNPVKSIPIVEGAKSDLINPVYTYWLKLGRFDGQSFTWLMPDALRNKTLGWSTKPTTFQSRTGEWWIGTGEGLYLFPHTDNFAALKTARPANIYSTKDGLATSEVFCVYEDSHGDAWISTVGSNQNGLARWERTTRTLHDMKGTEGLPSLKDKLPTAFREDGAGNLWVGFSQGELARYRGAKFELFTTQDGLPAGRVDYLYLDRAGRLWVAMMRGGLSRIDDPSAEHPAFVNYTTAQGLSSNYVTAITEDLFGRMYIGTGQGIDQLEPATGRIRHYTTADGLASGKIMDMARDREGSIWVGTTTGFSRLRPEPAQPAAPPPILIKGLRIAGLPQPISAMGETELHLPELPPSQNQLQIDFVGLSFAPGESLRYQYRLEGTDWSTPTVQRTINYANLAAGRYRFLVRAVNSDGVTSLKPATVVFIVQQPVWQRWWFLLLVAVGTGLAVYALYRYRVSHLIALERVRTRIASDLHDDIGSGLSRLAILSEVARHDAGGTRVSERLGEIANVARELVDSMSDVVWLINPKRDQLSDLVQRMRRFAADLLTAKGIELTFQGPDERRVKVDTNVRRHLFLIFKEAVNNAARHSGCTKADIRFGLDDGHLVLTVKDNGQGFDPAQAVEGNGLINMRERARLLQAMFLVTSDPGSGTTIKLRTPVWSSSKGVNGRRRGPRAL
jgi:ligand-binding sensor domain-containing protein/two-component sensor histidine kinase